MNVQICEYFRVHVLIVFHQMFPFVMMTEVMDVSRPFNVTNIAVAEAVALVRERLKISFLEKLFVCH